MNRTTWILPILTGGLLALSGLGCGKGGAFRQPQTIEDGVAQARTALATASPAVRSNLYTGVSFSIRYGRYPEALAALDQIAGDPSLNERQKKVVNDLAALIKQAIQNQQTPPRAAQ